MMEMKIQACVRQNKALYVAVTAPFFMVWDTGVHENATLKGLANTVSQI